MNNLTLNPAAAHLTQKVSTRTAIRTWMAGRNQLLSDLMERTVTNRQSLLVWHTMTAFSALILLSGTIAGTLFGLTWSILALTLCKKGGLR